MGVLVPEIRIGNIIRGIYGVAVFYLKNGKSPFFIEKQAFLTV